MKIIKLLLPAFFLFFFTTYSLGQEDVGKDKFTEIKTNLLFGLNQPLLGGFNIEGNFFYNRIVFDYSHGISLNFDNAVLDKENQAANIDIHIPWTTGFGLGYRFNDWLNLRAEPKWHKFELYQMGEKQIIENLIGSYTTFTLGLGAYANIQPFSGQNNFLKGIMIAPSVRWWPRVSSSLDNNEMNFYSESLEQNVTHEALEIGFSNTPFFVNISVGYSLGWNK